MTAQLIRMTVNGREREVHVDPWRSLLHVLREQLGLTGVKLGCEAGECGACTVLLDGAPVVSCVALGVDAHGRTVETVEGIAETDRLHPLQEEFVKLSAFQCGYCAPGFVMSAKALLAENPSPTESEIRQAVAGNLCRCTAYVGIVKAIGDIAVAGRD